MNPIAKRYDNSECVLRTTFECTADTECNYSFSLGSKLLSHLKAVHSGEQFTSPCLYALNCFHRDNFRSYKALDKHLRKFHPKFFTNVQEELVGDLSDRLNIGENERQGHVLEESSASQEIESAQTISLPEVIAFDNEERSRNQNRNVEGDFVLKLMTEHKLTQQSMQGIKEETSLLLKEIVHRELLKVKKALQENSCSHITLIDNLIEDANNLQFFESLKNERQQQKYFEDKFDMIKPKKIFFNPHHKVAFKRLRTGKPRHLITRNYVYVPIVEQLEQILKVPGLYQEILKPKTNRPGTYASYNDGSNFQNSEFFISCPDGIQLHIYLDEVELCNEIGSKTHKLVFVYFSLGNIDPLFRSSFKHIHLLSIFYQNCLDESHDLNFFLSQLVSDLKILETGVPMLIEGGTKIIRAAVTAVVADNLASHQVGGFKSGFGRGTRKCRTCLATEEEIQSKFSDCEFIRRSKDDHNQVCASMLVDELHEHFSKLYGINRNCVFNELRYFHVIGGLVPDIMHDILEGIIPLFVSQLLLKYIDKRYFSLDYLNNILVSFDYGSSEVKNKPSPILRRHLIKNNIVGSATQRWCLATLLPIMIGAKIPKNSLRWEAFCQLLHICRLVFSRTVEEHQIFILGGLINDFLQNYKKLFKKKIIPKMHHLIHYPQYIREIGPLGAVWCMRYEGKHAYFKSMQKKIKNFINPPWSLAKRHQQWQCAKLKNASPLDFNFKFSPKNSRFPIPRNEVEENLDFSNKTPNINNQIPISNQFYFDNAGQIASFFNLDSSDIVTSGITFHQWVNINSLKLKCNESVILCPLQGENRSNQFGLVVGIAKLEKRVGIICKMLRTRAFNRHFQSFCVVERDDNFHMILSPSEVSDLRPNTLHKPCGVQSELVESKYYVSTKYEYSEMLCKPSPFKSLAQLEDELFS